MVQAEAEEVLGGLASLRARQGEVASVQHDQQLALAALQVRDCNNPPSARNAVARVLIACPSALCTPSEVHRMHPVVELSMTRTYH